MATRHQHRHGGRGRRRPGKPYNTTRRQLRPTTKASKSAYSTKK